MEVLSKEKGFNYFSTLSIFSKAPKLLGVAVKKQSSHCLTVYKEALFSKLELVIGAPCLVELVVEAEIFQSFQGNRSKSECLFS